MGVSPSFLRQTDVGPLRGLLLLGAALTPFNYVVSLPVGPVTLHPLQLWSLALVLFALALRPRMVLAAADSPVLLVWTMFAFVFMSTVFGTPEEYRLRGFLDVVLLAINLAAFMLVYGLLRSEPSWWDPFARALFAASLVSSTFLVVRALSAAQAGQFLLPDSYMFGLGTVTGTFTAALTAACMAGAVFSPTRRLRLLMLLGVAVHGDAASLSLARGPWLGGAMATVITFVVAGYALSTLRARALALARLAVATVCLAVVTTATTVLSSAVTRIVAARVVDVANVRSGTGRARINLFDALWDDAMDSPVFGHGASAYRQVSEFLQRQGAISENFVLEMFHAGGVMAVLPLMLAAAVVAMRLLRSLQTPHQSGLAAICLAGALALMLGALTNPAAWDTAFWVFVATAAALRSLALTPVRTTPEAFEAATPPS